MLESGSNNGAKYSTRWIPNSTWDESALDGLWRASKKGFFAFSPFAPTEAWNSVDNMNRSNVDASAVPSAQSTSLTQSYPELAPFFPVASTSYWMDPWMMQHYHGYWW